MKVNRSIPETRMLNGSVRYRTLHQVQRSPTESRPLHIGRNLTMARKCN